MAEAIPYSNSIVTRLSVQVNTAGPAMPVNVIPGPTVPMLCGIFRHTVFSSFGIFLLQNLPAGAGIAGPAERERKGKTMLKPVPKEEAILRCWTGRGPNRAVVADIEEFRKMDADAALVTGLDHYKNVASARCSYHKAIKKMGVNVMVTIRSGNLYLIKKTTPREDR